MPQQADFLSRESIDNWEKQERQKRAERVKRKKIRFSLLGCLVILILMFGVGFTLRKPLRDGFQHIADLIFHETPSPTNTPDSAIEPVGEASLTDTPTPPPATESPADTPPANIPTPTTEPPATPTADATATAQAIAAAAQAELIATQTAQATPVDPCLTDKGPGNYNLSIVPGSLTLDPPPGPLISWDAPLTATWRVMNTGSCPWTAARFDFFNGVSTLKNLPVLAPAGPVEPNAEAEVVLSVAAEEVAWKTGHQWEWQPMVQTADESWLQRGDKLALVLTEPWVTLPVSPTPTITPTATPPPTPTSALMTIQLIAPNPQAIERYRGPEDPSLKFEWKTIDRALAPGENFVVVVTNPNTNEKIYRAAGTSFAYNDTAKIREFMAKINAPSGLEITWQVWAIQGEAQDNVAPSARFAEASGTFIWENK